MLQQLIGDPRVLKGVLRYTLNDLLSGSAAGRGALHLRAAGPRT